MSGVHYEPHRVATSSCRGEVDESATEPFLLLHREHGTGCRRSWNCCDRRTRFVVIWKHFCLTSGVGIAWPVYSWNYRFPHLTLLFTTRVFCFKINWLGPQTVLCSGLQC